eukprot:1937558-Prymnesium_polylepis.1
MTTARTPPSSPYTARSTTSGCLAETAHAVPFTSYFLNPLFVRAWQLFEREACTIIIKAAKKIGLSPFNPDAISYDSAAVSK